EIKSVVDSFITADAICFDTETTGLDALTVEIVGLSLSNKKNTGFYIPFPEDQDATTSRLTLLKPILENEKIIKIGQNLKYDILVLRKYNIGVKGKLF